MRRERAWKLEEIKFLNDTVKILQSILTRRTRENTLSDSNAALEAVLDHVGSAVYVLSRKCPGRGEGFVCQQKPAAGIFSGAAG